jgi:hypothetical protein
MINPDDRRSVIEGIEQYGDLSEVYEITTFKGYRRDETGQPVEVTVEVGDSGKPGDYRWIVTATDYRGRVGGTNGGGSLDEALGTVHWEKLDRDEQ